MYLVVHEVLVAITHWLADGLANDFGRPKVRQEWGMGQAIGSHSGGNALHLLNFLTLGSQDSS